MLATGYRVDISRYEFLGPGLLQALRVNDGYPELSVGLEFRCPVCIFSVRLPRDPSVRFADSYQAPPSPRALLPARFWERTVSN
jgi:hypothetical protein